MAFKSLDPTDETFELHARKCNALAQIAKAWDAAADRARILRGRPLPGSMRPGQKGAPRRRSIGPAAGGGRRELTVNGKVARPVAQPFAAGSAIVSEPASPSPTPAVTTPTTAPTAVAPPPAPRVEPPCQVCHGKKQLWISAHSVWFPCGKCKGTGLRPKPNA